MIFCMCMRARETPEIAYVRRRFSLILLQLLFQYWIACKIKGILFGASFTQLLTLNPRLAPFG